MSLCSPTKSLLSLTAHEPILAERDVPLSQWQTSMCILVRIIIKCLVVYQTMRKHQLSCYGDKEGDRVILEYE